jgi:hypothetical protein
MNQPYYFFGSLFRMYMHVWEFNYEQFFLVEINRGWGIRRGSTTCHDDSKASKDAFTHLEHAKVQLDSI